MTLLKRKLTSIYDLFSVSGPFHVRNYPLFRAISYWTRLILDIVKDRVHISLEEHKIDLRVPRPLPTVYCDNIRISEVFSNLITNAIKYNDKAEKWIEVGYHVVGQDRDHQPGEALDRTTAGEIVFYVRDNGIGIREKNLGNVFRIFKRLHAGDKFGGGTGVGLTIVKKIVERHSGQIWVHSSVGEGTTFYFTLSGANRV